MSLAGAEHDAEGEGGRRGRHDLWAVHATHTKAHARLALRHSGGIRPVEESRGGDGEALHRSLPLLHFNLLLDNHSMFIDWLVCV